MNDRTSASVSIDSEICRRSTTTEKERKEHGRSTTTTPNICNVIGKSSSSIYYYYNYLRKHLVESGQVVVNERQLNFWMELLYNRDKINYLKIIYILESLPGLHLSGFSKILGIVKQTLRQNIAKLQETGIIAPASKKDQSIQTLYSILQISNWHWRKAEIYALTDLGKAFFKSIPYEEILDSPTIENVEHYAQKLRRSHRQIQKKRKSDKKRIKLLFGWWKKQNRDLENPSPKDVNALELQLKKYNISATAEEILESWRGIND